MINNNIALLIVLIFPFFWGGGADATPFCEGIKGTGVAEEKNRHLKESPNRVFLKADNPGRSARIVLQQNKFSKKTPSNRD